MTAEREVLGDAVGDGLRFALGGEAVVVNIDSRCIDDTTPNAAAITTDSSIIAIIVSMSV